MWKLTATTRPHTATQIVRLSDAEPLRRRSEHGCHDRFGSCLRATGRSTCHDPLRWPSTRARPAGAEALQAPSITPALRGPVDGPATLPGLAATGRGPQPTQGGTGGHHAR